MKSQKYISALLHPPLYTVTRQKTQAPTPNELHDKVHVRLSKTYGEGDEALWDVIISLQSSIQIHILFTVSPYFG